MSKELQAFKELLKQLFPNYNVDVSFDDICNLNGNLKIIRDELKVLEIIKDKVLFEFLEEREEGKIIQRYFVIGNRMFPVTQEEFDLLKEYCYDKMPLLW